MPVQKYKSKVNLTEIFGLGKEEETEDQTVEYAVKLLIKEAKEQGVPSGRAYGLVQEIMNLYNTLVALKFDTSTKTKLKRAMKIFYSGVG
jgi:hypothetical protein